MPFHRPELLAPGGDLQALQVAVRNGADAVYFGLERFSARSAAKNLTLEQLPEALRFLHEHSARGYLALNTLMREEELPAALDLAHEAYQMGVDAIIVQDVGLLKRLRQELPGLILHASTQMSLGSAADLELAERLDLQRLVLPRELSGTELATLTRLAAAKNIETEAFIHGALCICTSGQCLMSSLIGGRSGNRGACAQPCRLDYQLNGQTGALYSPRDQSLLPVLPAITRTQLTSLKIEGRMRGPAYVGQVVAIYREALDTLAQMVADGLSAEAIEAIWPEQIQPGLQTLRQAFNRGGDFTHSYFAGANFSSLMVRGLPGSHGVFLGPVAHLDAHRGSLWIETRQTSLQPGDVLAIRRPARNQAESQVASAPIGSAQADSLGLLVKGFHPDSLRELKVGDLVYRMNDTLAEKKALKADSHKTAIDLVLDGARLQAQVTKGIFQGKSCDVPYTSDPSLAPLSPERAMEQLKKTGGTAFVVGSVKILLDIHLTIGQLNQLRRDCLQQLADLLDQPQRLDRAASSRAEPASQQTPADRITPIISQDGPAPQDEIAAYFYQLPADPADLACGADVYELPLLALDRARIEAIAAFLKHQEPQAKIVVHWPAVVSGQKSALVPALLAELSTWPIDGVCTSWPTGAHALKIADTTANLFNSESFTTALTQGAQTLCPSLELNGTQLETALRQTTWPNQSITVERPLYGRLRLMNTAYCPIGKNAVNCRTCVKSEQFDDARLYDLVDRKQQAFKVVPHPRICQADLLNSDLLSVPEEYLQVRSALPATASWRARLIFTDETPAEQRELVQAARRLFTDANPLQAAEQLTRITKRIATRLDTRLTNGHFQRGVI